MAEHHRPAGPGSQEGPGRHAGLGPLRSGARVALLATAGQVPEDRVADGERVLRGWGLEVVSMPTSRGTHPRARYLSGTDAERARDLQQAWCDPTVEGIFLVRGGYGTVRMLDLLDVDAIRAAAPKPVYGCSDITALQEFLDEQLGVASWHGPMVGSTSVQKNALAAEWLRQAVLDPWRGRVIAPEDASWLVPGSAGGRLIGGNLSLLAMTLGARTRPPLDHEGTIALLEDVHEATYKLDGYLTALLRAGWFDGVRAVACGSWHECKEPEVRELVLELLGPLDIPIAWNLGFGHASPVRTVPLGVDARLDGDTPRLTLPG
ncbi:MULTISPECIES: S66 peptidase family protein [unclassified Luteococcus]|uniref:S66 peptidase family protein n=1 Tax=unclassified Luteococcus TaxID=2639923 RepID=UPI00313AB3C2